MPSTGKKLHFVGQSDEKLLQYMENYGRILGARGGRENEKERIF